MKNPRIGAVDKVVNALLHHKAYRATMYMSRFEVIKATRLHKPSHHARSAHLVVSIGVPNWEQRQFIHAHKKAGTKLPKTVQIKHWPVKRPAAKKAKVKAK